MLTTRTHAATWMQDVFLGASEKAVLANRAGFVAAPPPGGALTFCHEDGQTTWSAGRFECVSVATLRERLQRDEESRPHKQRKPAPIPLTIVDGVDVGVLQASLTTDQRALVQIASNFNALEVAGRHVRPDYGGLVTKYAVDSTQGPAASFGTPAASLLRAHYAFYSASGETAAEEWGQTAARQVELLRDVREHFGTCVNGKVTLSGAEAPIGGGGGGAEPAAAEAAAAVDAAVEAVAERIQVGLHTDCEVLFCRGGHRGELTVLPAGGRPLVDQILSASVNLHDTGLPRRASGAHGGTAPGDDGEADDEETRLGRLVRACLRAAYEGAYLAAIGRARRVLLLTLIGGGTFGNDLDDILVAIANAHREHAPRAPALEEVRLCLYSRGAAEEARARLRALAPDVAVE